MCGFNAAISWGLLTQFALLLSHLVRADINVSFCLVDRLILNLNWTLSFRHKTSQNFLNKKAVLQFSIVLTSRNSTQHRRLVAGEQSTIQSPLGMCNLVYDTEVAKTHSSEVWAHYIPCVPCPQLCEWLAVPTHSGIKLWKIDRSIVLYNTCVREP